MSCIFCFAHFKGIQRLSKEKGINLVQEIVDYGFKKINFVGGEPTLVPWLKSVLKKAHDNGLVTSIITNGWNIEPSWLDDHDDYLDWIGLSIDSLLPSTNERLGRKVQDRKTPELETYLDSINLIREYDIKLKINTVISQLNNNESFHNLIKKARPSKWKIFQVIIIDNENPDAKKLAISKREFEEFLNQHKDLQKITEIYPEYSEDMKGSYLMIDPSGRIVDNTLGIYRYSDCVLDVGFSKALSQINLSTEKYNIRRDQDRVAEILSKNVRRRCL
jgi:radical S-adenosyl methionine domain-containing protein 2